MLLLLLFESRANVWMLGRLSTWHGRLIWTVPLLANVCRRALVLLLLRQRSSSK